MVGPSPGALVPEGFDNLPAPCYTLSRHRGAKRPELTEGEIMPRNTRNVWLTAHVDGRASLIEGGPATKLGGMSATIRQRSDGGIGDYRTRVATFVAGGRIRTEVSIDTEKRYRFPALFLETFRDQDGETVTLDIPGVEAAHACQDVTKGLQVGAPSVMLNFRTTEERDAFLSVLAVHRNAQAEVSA